MNARGRIKRTIFELLKTTPADQLAVKTLVLEANISKQTLYNNFYGILDAACAAGQRTSHVHPASADKAYAAG